MADERNTSITTQDLALLVGAELLGPGDLLITHVASLEDAGPGALTWIRSARYAPGWPNSRASAALVSRDVPLGGIVDEAAEHAAQPSRAVLVVADADVAFSRALELFAPRPAPPAPGVHSSAWVDPTAVVSGSASVGPNCTVSAGARVGEATVLLGNVFLGQSAEVGARCVLHPGVAILERCVLGDDCTLHAGVIIGADGFGYRPSPDGRGLIKVPHIGNVVLADHIEVGANSCIDRAKFGSTHVGSGTKIDNLVQVGHGCRIGRCCILCGHAGLSGSVTLGDGVMLGGKVGVADNIEIGAGARVAAYAAVMNNVPAGAAWMGMPAGPAGEWRRTYAMLRKMGKRAPTQKQ